MDALRWSHLLMTQRFFSYEQGTDTSYLIFSDPKFKSLKEGEEYTLKVDFLRGGKLDQSWGEAKFNVSKLDGGDYMLSGRFDGDDLLTDVSRSDSIGFFLEKRLVDGFSLAGSAEAVAAVRKCAAIVEKENPSDPFEK